MSAARPCCVSRRRAAMRRCASRVAAATGDVGCDADCRCAAAAALCRVDLPPDSGVTGADAAGGMWLSASDRPPLAPPLLPPAQRLEAKPLLPPPVMVRCRCSWADAKNARVSANDTA